MTPRPLARKPVWPRTIHAVPLIGPDGTTSRISVQIPAGGQLTPLEARRLLKALAAAVARDAIPYTLPRPGRTKEG